MRRVRTSLCETRKTKPGLALTLPISYECTVATAAAAPGGPSTSRELYATIAAENSRYIAKVERRWHQDLGGHTQMEEWSKSMIQNGVQQRAIGAFCM
jgi:hypothetical protein